MKTLNRLIRIALCGLLLVAGAAGAQEYNVPEAEGQGEIQRLDFSSHRALIGGYQYDVSRSARVEIGGSYGAFTMLTEGMLVEFDFLHYTNGRREIVSMREVRDLEGI